MQPYDYTINTPRMPDLMQAMQMGQQMKANRQEYGLNQLKIQEYERAQKEQQGVKSAMADLLTITGGDVDKAAVLAPTKYAGYSPLIIDGLAKLKKAKYEMGGLDIDRQKSLLDINKTQGDVATALQSSLSKTGAPMAENFLKIPEAQRLDAFRPFAEGWKNAGLPVDPTWVEQGYTPEVGQQLQSIASTKEAQKPFISFEERKTLEQMKQTGMDRRSRIANRLREIDLGLKSRSLTQKEKQQLRDNRKQDMDLKSKLEGLENTKYKLDIYEDDAREIYDNADLWTNAGIGKGLSAIPGTVAADVKAKLGFILNNIVVDAVAEAKKSGVTFGSMTESEWGQMKNAVANLDPNQSPEQYRESVGRLVTRIEKSKNMINNDIRNHEQFLFGDDKSYNPDDFWGN